MTLVETTQTPPVLISTPPSVLLIAAHPDDEYYCAATLYRVARELNGIVDQMIVTDGAGGHRFAALAGHVYGLDLTEGGKDHALLPEIRREESLRAGKLLGVRHTEFLGQPDPGYTQQERDAHRAWRLHELKHRIEKRILSHVYDAIFVLSPNPGEHGHHIAVANLTIEILDMLPAQQRPLLLAVEPAHSSRPATNPPVFQFSRSRAVSRAESLTYSVIVNWLIAEYKSQGLFQLESGRHDCERFWPLGLTDPERARYFLAQIG
ncbi:MAG: PIG-L family deacetylase [Acidobacteria bacterium]|nr:PIG-L family deacetylase [Acidobacteriota bacterium]